MVAVQLTAPQTELQGLAGKAPPAPALPARRRREGRAPICHGPGGMQCPLPTHSQTPMGGCRRWLWGSALAASAFAGVESADSWKHQLGWPQPGAVQAAPRASPRCARSRPRCAGVPSLGPGTGGCSQTTSEDSPCHHPVPQPSPALHSPSEQSLLPDQLRAVCFWQQLWKD